MDGRRHRRRYVITYRHVSGGERLRDESHQAQHSELAKFALQHMLIDISPVQSFAASLSQAWVQSPLCAESLSMPPNPSPRWWSPPRTGSVINRCSWLVYHRWRRWWRRWCVHHRWWRRIVLRCRVIRTLIADFSAEAGQCQAKGNT